jgi:hypothetical protein
MGPVFWSPELLKNKKTSLKKGGYFMSPANLSVQQITAKINKKELSWTELGATLSHRNTHAQKKLNLFISFEPQLIAAQIKKNEQNMQADRPPPVGRTGGRSRQHCHSRSKNNLCVPAAGYLPTAL